MKNITKLNPDIYVVHNLLPNSLLLKINEYIKELHESDWVNETGNDFWRNRTLSDLKSKENGLIGLAHYEIARTIFSSYLEITGLSLSRYFKGDNIDLHVDNHPGHTGYHIRYGIVLYYNDDYEGGELYYPELDIKYKPKSNDLVIHGGNIWHKSLPVSSKSIRYFSTAFIKGTLEKPVVLNKNLFKGIEESDGTIYR